MNTDVLRRIVVPTDFSEGATEAWRLARRLARRRLNLDWTCASRDEIEVFRLDLNTNRSADYESSRKPFYIQRAAP